MIMRTLLVLIILFAATLPALADETRDVTGAPTEREQQRGVAPSAPTTPTAPVKPSASDPRANLTEQIQKAKDAQENLRAREIIILTESQRRGEIMSTLTDQGLPATNTYSLRALGQVLVLTKGTPEDLRKLRSSLPGVHVDWNEDLSAASSPRLFAKKQIQWPDKGSCLEKATKIPIGIIDGAIQKSHPAFAGQSILEENFLDDTVPDYDHATAIASILIGNAPEQGFDGLLPNAKLYNAVALRNAPNDQRLASSVAVLRGIDWLMQNKVRLINISLTGAKNRVLEAAVNAALTQGAVIFAAAGNNGPDAPPAYPAAIDGVFAVTAIDARADAYKGANTGAYIDYAAPGVDVWVAQSGGGGAYQTGTSYASPFAMGISALYLSQNPNLSRVLLGQLLNKNGIEHLLAQCPESE